MLEGICSFKEATTGVIHLPEIEAHVFEQIMSYLMQDWSFNSNLQSQRKIIFSVEMKEESVMELLLACHFLDIPDLLETTCKMLADNISRLSTLSLFPMETLQQIYKHTNDLELIKLENNCKDKNLLDGYLASSEIWKMKYHAKKWNLDRTNYLQSYLPACNITIPPFMNPAYCFPNIFSFFSKQDEIIDWKQEFIQRFVQSEISNFIAKEETNSLGELIEIVKICSPFIKMIKIPSILFKCLLKNQKSSNSNHLFEFLSHLHYLEHLDISNFSVSFDDLTILIDFIPKCLFKLKSIVFRNINACDKMLTLICSLLNVHPIESLDITENVFSHIGIVYLSHTLCKNTSLKLLTINSNQYRLNNQKIHISFLPYWQRDDFLQNQQQNHDYFYYIKQQLQKQNSEFIYCKYAIDSLFKCLEFNHTLELLDIGHTEVSLSDIPLEYWKSLKENKTLKYLLLQGSSIRFDEENIQENIFEYLPISLKYLDISKLENFDSDILCANLARAAPYFENLRVLDISHYNLSRQFSLNNVMVFVKNSPNLCSLNINRCKISNHLAFLIADCLLECNSLEYLYASSNTLSDEANRIIDAGKQSLQNYKKKLFIDISFNNIPYSLLESAKDNTEDLLTLNLEQ